MAELPERPCWEWIWQEFSSRRSEESRSVRVEETRIRLTEASFCYVHAYCSLSGPEGAGGCAARLLRDRGRRATLGSQDDISTGFHKLMGFAHSFSTYLVMISVASPAIELHK